MYRQWFGPFAMLAFLGVVLFGADQALHSASEPSVTRYPQPLPALLDPDRSNLTQQELEDLARDRKNFKQQRQAYLDGLHRAAPGTDWRAMDRERRTQLARERAAARASLLDRGLDPSVLPVTINTRTRAVTGTWAEKGSDNLAGRMHVAAIHNSTIYAGSSGGIVWRGTLSGDDWTPLNDWLQMDDIASVDVLPGAGAGDHRLVVFHGGTDMLHYSDDDGASWQAAPGLDGPASWGGPMRGELLGDPDQTMFLLAQEWDYDQWHSAVGFYRSGDQGASFQRVRLFDQERHRADMWCPSTTSGPGYLVRGNDIHSFDALGNLTPQGTLTVSHGDGQVRRTQLRGRIGPNGLDLYVAYALDDGTTSIYAWVRQGAPANYYVGSVPQTSFAVNSFEVSQARDAEFYLGGVDCYRSSDGAHWTPVNYWYEYYGDPQHQLHADIPGIQVFDVGGSELALIATDGGLYTSTDGLQTVENISLRGLRISQYYGSYTHRSQTNVVYAGSQDQGFQRSLAGGGGLIDFEQTISGDYAHLVSADGGASIWSVYPGFAMYYPDAVNSTQMETWDFAISGQLWLPPLMEDPRSANVCWLGGGSSSGGAHLVRIDASGGGISAIEGAHDFGNTITALTYSHLDDDTWYVMTSDGSFHFSLDGGDAWQVSPAFTGPEGHYFHGASIVASPVDTGTVWIAGSGYSNPPVYVSHDRGQSFVAMDMGLPSTLVYDLAVSDDGSLLFAATELGPYAWDAQDATWRSVAGVVAPDQVYWNVDWVEGLQTARFVTYGRGIWDFAVDESSAAPEAPAAVSPFALTAAPNPFNPHTLVSFDLPRGAFVELDAYDVRGAKVGEVFRGALVAGRHEFRLDGETLASGVYLLRLSADGRYEDLRVTLIK